MGYYLNKKFQQELNSYYLYTVVLKHSQSSVDRFPRAEEVEMMIDNFH
jgi:hypothetical protein